MKDSIIITPLKIFVKNDTTNIIISKSEDTELYDYIVEQSKEKSSEELFELAIGALDVEMASEYIQQTFALPEGITISHGKLYYKQICLSGDFVKRFALTDKDNMPKMVKFIEKLSQVNARDVFEMICGFLEAHPDIMIDDEGDLLMWKVIRDDYYACHENPDGTRNKHEIGVAIEMPRTEVERNSNVTCSTGLHLCAKSYIDSFRSHDNIVVICKLNVNDIVSIPYDYNNAKLRCCKYIPVEFVDIPQNVANKECANYEDKYNGMCSAEYKTNENGNSQYMLTDNDLVDIITTYLSKQKKYKTIRELQHNCSRLKKLSVRTIYNFISKYGKKLNIKIKMDKEHPAVSYIKVKISN